MRRLLAFALLTLPLFGCNKDGKTNAKEPIRVSADDFINGHLENKAQAENKYKGQTVIVTGFVYRPKELAAMPLTVYLRGKNPKVDVIINGRSNRLIMQCRFNQDRESESKPLQDGQPVSIQGEYGGGGLLKCQVVDTK